MNTKILKYGIFAFIFYAPFANAQSLPENKNFSECLKIASENPQKGIDYAIDWRARFGNIDAQHCLGVAYIENEDYENGAKILSNLAPFISKDRLVKKTTILSQSANGYLLAHLPDEALIQINKAIELDEKNADLLVDRARIYAMQENWKDSEGDLNKAMALKQEIPFTLRLRAEARLQLKKYNEAERDINHAILLDPKDGENYFVRGRIREAKRNNNAAN